jgi:TolB-like protein
MKYHYTKAVSGLLIILALQGCTTASTTEEDDQSVVNDSYTERGMALNKIVSTMADRLFVTKVPGNNVLNPIAVTSISNLSTLENTDWLGLQLEENFVHELHRRGEVVMDYKVTGSIRVTPEGDFTMSRDWKELSKRIPVGRVLTGTMSRYALGVMVNMRIINMRTHMVEATAQGFVPNDILKTRLGAMPMVTVTKGMVVRGEYGYDQYGRAVSMSH